MKSAGIVRSAYHFFHCDTDAATQASFFLGVMGALEPGDLPPSLDFEDTTTCTPSTGIAMAITWARRRRVGDGHAPEPLHLRACTQQLRRHGQPRRPRAPVGREPRRDVPFAAVAVHRLVILAVQPDRHRVRAAEQQRHGRPRSVQRRPERAPCDHGRGLFLWRVGQLEQQRWAELHGRRRRGHLHRDLRVRGDGRLHVHARLLPGPRDGRMLHTSRERLLVVGRQRALVEREHARRQLRRWSLQWERGQRVAWGQRQTERRSERVERERSAVRGKRSGWTGVEQRRVQRRAGSALERDAMDRDVDAVGVGARGRANANANATALGETHVGERRVSRSTVSRATRTSRALHGSHCPLQHVGHCVSGIRSSGRTQSRYQSWRPCFSLAASRAASISSCEGMVGG